MEQKLSDTLVKAIDRSNPFMQNLQLASRFNKLIDEGGGDVDLEDNHEVSITENGTIEITPAEGKDGMKKVTANVSVAGSGVNAFENIFPAIYITYNESIDEPPYRTCTYVAVTEDGAFVDLAHLEQAKFLVSIDSSGNPTYIYTTGAEGTTFGEYACITGQDFTVTDGKIILNGGTYSIFDFPKISFADAIYTSGS